MLLSMAFVSFQPLTNVTKWGTLVWLPQNDPPSSRLKTVENSDEPQTSLKASSASASRVLSIKYIQSAHPKDDNN